MRYLRLNRERTTFWQRVGFTYRKKPRGWVIKSAEGHRSTGYGPRRPTEERET